MAANPRKSQDAKNRKGVGGPKAFLPDLKEWIECFKIYPYNRQIQKHFGICEETFYAFIDKQKVLEEEGKPSAYLEAYKYGRNETRKTILSTLINCASTGSKEDMPALIFASKTYGGLLEEKDIKHIELKKIEVAFKTKQFLTDLANKFNLSYEQLDEFAKKFFSDKKLDDI